MAQNDDLAPCESEPPAPEPATIARDAVFALVGDYQCAYQRWCTEATKRSREQLKRENSGRLEQIYSLIHPNLRGLARRLLRTDRARDDILSSAVSYEEDVLTIIEYDLFTYIIEALPHVHAEPDKNTIGLLITIADRGWNNDRFYRRSLRTTALDDPALTEASLARDLEADSVHDRIARADVQQHFRAFLARCKQIDRLIGDARMLDPPTSFKAIAERLGPGYTEQMLRKRWERLLERFQKSPEADDLASLLSGE